jgi:ATP-dependent helicase/DNAse subunit B
VEGTNRRDRLAARSEGQLDTTAFLKTADKFIDLANRENKKIKATDLHMAFLYAAARYNAYVAKNIQRVDEHEKFVSHMVKQYQEMLRQHLADETLDPDD